MMQDNSLSIHVETGNAFYDNFNTNESFCHFLHAEQDEKKKKIEKTNYCTLTTLNNVCSVFCKDLILKKLINTTYTQTKTLLFFL